MLFLPMEYVEGKGTNYSYSPLAILGYSLFLLFCTASLILILMRRKNAVSVEFFLPARHFS